MSSVSPWLAIGVVLACAGCGRLGFDEVIIPPPVDVVVMDCPTRTNVARDVCGARVTASSESPSGRFPVASTIDGVRDPALWGLGNGWNDGTRAEFPDSLSVDLGRSRTIDEVLVFTVPNNWKTIGPIDETTPATSEGVLDVTVQVAAGATWIPVASVAGNELALMRFTFTAAVTTTAIDVIIGNSRNSYARILEVEAYGQ